MPERTVTYVLVNNLGGINSFIQNLIRFRGEDTLPQSVVLLDVKGNTNAPITDAFDGIRTTTFNYSSKENWYTQYRSLATLIDASKDKGVLVSNDVFDLIMLTHYNISKKVVQIIHDGYNVKLAIQYQQVVDAFICHSLFFYEVISQLIPERRKDIYYIPYGIPSKKIDRVKRNTIAPLKLIFLGRHDKMKGIYDLFVINSILKKMEIPIEWLILGRGPETENIKKQWAGESNIRFYSPEQNSEVLDICKLQDILVLPTKFEGFPVAMVEAMSVGCVPIVSDLPGGIRELLKNETGFACTLDDNNAFAKKIARLYREPLLLQQMSINCIDYISRNHNAEMQSPIYQALLKEISFSEGTPRHHQVKEKLGSRLDQPWIPNFITSFIRRRLLLSN